MASKHEARRCAVAISYDNRRRDGDEPTHKSLLIVNAKVKMYEYFHIKMAERILHKDRLRLCDIRVRNVQK